MQQSMSIDTHVLQRKEALEKAIIAPVAEEEEENTNL